MEHQFDRQEAKKFLLAKEEKERQQREDERKDLLQKVVAVLKEQFIDSGIEVYLVGSILQPFRFTSSSDIDIVIRNFKGDRFEIWTKLEGLLQRDVEIIPFETCHFTDFVLTEGLRVA